LDGTLGIIDRVGIRAILIDIPLGEVAALDTHPCGIVILVEQTIDHRDILPLGVGRELHLAGGEEERSKE
jgi:hypothetical protein